jgi:hypothetical protein
VTAAGVHDDAGAFPRFDESPARFRAVELQSQVIHVIHKYHERGGVRFHFLQQRAAIDDLAARCAHDVAETDDGCRECGNAGGGDATPGCARFADGGGAEVADGGHLVDEFLPPQFHDLALAHVHVAVTVEVAGFLEMIRQRAGQNKRGIFERGFSHRLGIASTAVGGIGSRGLGGDGAVIGLKLRQVRAEVGGRFAIPDGFIVGSSGRR